MSLLAAATVLLLQTPAAAPPGKRHLGSATPILLDQAWEHHGAQAGASFGSALAGGDVDGDGFEDLLVGSPGAGNGPRLGNAQASGWFARAPARPPYGATLGPPVLVVVKPIIPCSTASSEYIDAAPR